MPAAASAEKLFFPPGFTPPQSAPAAKGNVADPATPFPSAALANTPETPAGSDRYPPKRQEKPASYAQSSAAKPSPASLAASLVGPTAAAARNAPPSTSPTAESLDVAAAAALLPPGATPDAPPTAAERTKLIHETPSPDVAALLPEGLAPTAPLADSPREATPIAPTPFTSAPASRPDETLRVADSRQQRRFLGNLIIWSVCAGLLFLTLWFLLNR